MLDNETNNMLTSAERERIIKSGRYKTQSIDEGAWYLAKDCKIVDKEIINMMVTFTFEAEPSLLAKLVEEWRGKKPVVNACKYCGAIHELKKEVFRFVDYEKRSLLKGKNGG